jgi:hypothetical protein
MNTQKNIQMKNIENRTSAQKTTALKQISEALSQIKANVYLF